MQAAAQTLHLWPVCVWHYTLLVGKIVKMPEAFQVWPPVKNWRRHVVDQATLLVKAAA